ncbi:MAG: phosphoenolpyruvate--protein phosphotransferase [Verrucomicrobiae bacterium]|nr:phosphoenolpyruvate--protein phosphotransferase [Verrucomicrobiae bacterium]
MAHANSSAEFRVTGLAASPGLAQARLLIIDFDDITIPRYSIEENQITDEIARFNNAIEKTKHQLIDIQKEVRENLGEKDAEIFEAHLLVLEDATLLGATHKQLALKKLNVEAVYHHVIQHYTEALESLKDSYLCERAADVRDVSRRVFQNLTGNHGSLIHAIKEPCIIVAYDLTPSETAQLPRDKVMGFVTYIGSKTSHAAIMARSMDIPAIVGLQESPITLESGMFALLDGTHGVLVINPSPETIAQFGALESRHEAVVQNLEQLRETKAVTLDNRHIMLSANIEILEDLPDILESGAEGIGLFRSEFLFTQSDHLPDEETQYQSYLQAAQSVKPYPIILRTLDIGGDKLMGDYFEEDQNPFLGVRAIRFCLAHPDLFRTQLRAMLRASTEKNVKIMLPMVSGLSEVLQAKTLIEEEKEKLRQQGIPFDEKIELGIMVETPSAALIADILAKEVNFFSIGTNDLIQYSIAIDRGNERLAHLYEPTHPGVLRLIRQIIQAAHENSIWCGLCGEMAGDFILVPLLVGLGVDELSSGAAQVPRVKRVIQSISYEEMKTLAHELLQLTSSSEIINRLDELGRARFPELFE